MKFSVVASKLGSPVVVVIVAGCAGAQAPQREAERPPTTLQRSGPQGPKVNSTPSPQRAEPLVYRWVNPTENDCEPKSVDESKKPNDSQNPSAEGTAPLPSTVSTSILPNASQVVARMRPGFRDCYQALLTHRDRNATGHVRMRFDVDCTGTIRSIRAEVTGLDKETVECMFTSANQARFGPPAGGAAVVVVPVTFVPKEGESHNAPPPKPP